MRRWIALLLSTGVASCVLAQNGDGEWTVEDIDGLWQQHLVFRMADVGQDNPVYETYARDALALDPRDTDLAANLARYYLRKQEPAMTAMAMLYLKLLDPEHALLREKWQLVMEAIRLFPVGPQTLKSIPPDSDHAEGLRRAARAIRSERYVAAENYYRLIMNTHPVNHLLIESLGSTYVRAENWAMAAMLYRYAVHLYPEDQIFANNYALALIKVGFADEAVIFLREKMEEHPENGLFCRNLGTVLWEQGDVAGAAEAFAGWTTAAPAKPEAWEAYGECLLRNDQYVFAKVALRKALDLDPASSRPLELLLFAALMENRDIEIERWSTQLRKLMTAEEWGALLQREPYSRLRKPEEAP